MLCPRFVLSTLANDVPLDGPIESREAQGLPLNLMDFKEGKQMQVEKKVYRLPEVLMMYGFSKPTLYRAMDEGRFPRAVQLSKRTVGWTAESLARYDKSLISGGV